MSSIIRIAVILVAVFQIAQTWPWNRPADKQEDKKTEAEEAQELEKYRQPWLGWDSSKEEEPEERRWKTSEELTAEEKEVMELQQQIRELMQVHQSIKSQYATQASEIQQISQQAKIHEQMLTNLRKPVDVSATQNTRVVDEIIRQEKLRLIREQTKNNRKLVQNYKQTQKIREVKKIANVV